MKMRAIESILGIIVAAILVVIFVPDTRKGLGRSLSELPVIQEDAITQYAEDRKWEGPDYQNIDVYFAKTDIWPDQVITENMLETKSQRMHYKEIRAYWWPAKQDIKGTKPKELILAGSRFHKWNLNKSNFTKRDIKGKWIVRTQEELYDAIKSGELK